MNCSQNNSLSTSYTIRRASWLAGWLFLLSAGLVKITMFGKNIRIIENHITKVDCFYNMDGSFRMNEKLTLIEFAFEHRIIGSIEILLD